MTGVVCLPGAGYDTPLWNVDLALRPGQLCLVHVPVGRRHTPLADLAEGLVHPDRGEVTFQGERWGGLGPGQAAARRARIGRVFHQGQWLDNLTAAENVELAQLHHTRRKAEDVRAEAVALSRLMGLPGLPLDRVRNHRADDLQRAACVRAFMGTPELVLLETPAGQTPGQLVDPLIQLVRRGLGHGAAVIWITCNETVWTHRQLHPRFRGRLVGTGTLLIEP
jgi:phospholipid/cholesterol/gamma-HCH transport system ATP-binding protein